MRRRRRANWDFINDASRRYGYIDVGYISRHTQDRSLMEWLAEGDNKFPNWRSCRIAAASGYLATDKPAYGHLEKFFRVHPSTVSIAGTTRPVELGTATHLATEGVSSCSTVYSELWKGQEPAFQLRALDLYRNWLTRDDVPALMETALLWAVVKEWRQALAAGHDALGDHTLPDDCYEPDD